MASPAVVVFHTTHSPWQAGRSYPMGGDGVPESQARDLARAGKCDIVYAATGKLERAEKRERGSTSVGADVAELQQRTLPMPLRPDGPDATE